MPKLSRYVIGSALLLVAYFCLITSSLSHDMARTIRSIISSPTTIAGLGTGGTDRKGKEGVRMCEIEAYTRLKLQRVCNTVVYARFHYEY